MSPASSCSGSGSNGFTQRPDTVCRYGPGAGGAEASSMAWSIVLRAGGAASGEAAVAQPLPDGAQPCDKLRVEAEGLDQEAAVDVVDRAVDVSGAQEGVDLGRQARRDR